MIPDPGFRIDPFAHSAKKTEAREIAVFNVRHAPLHKGADGRWGGVENRGLFLFDDLPEAALIGRIRRSFVDQDARPGSQGSVGHIAVAGDPAAVGGAPKKIVVAEIKNPLSGCLSPEQIASC